MNFYQIMIIRNYFHTYEITFSKRVIFNTFDNFHVIAISVINIKLINGIIMFLGELPLKLDNFATININALLYIVTNFLKKTSNV